MKYEEIKRKLQKGFTLTEMMVVVAIFLLIIVAVYSTYSLSRRAYLAGEKIAEITQNGRVILERISREIRQAKEIATELPTERVNPSDEIKFQDGHLPLISYHYIHYYRDTDNNIWRRIVAYCFSEDSLICVQPETYMPWNAVPPSGQTLLEITLESPRIIGEYVTNLEFWGSRVISIFLTLQEEDKNIDLETKIFGRNL